MKDSREKQVAQLVASALVAANITPSRSVTEWDKIARGLISQIDWLRSGKGGMH